MAKAKMVKLKEMTLDDLVRHQFGVLLDMKTSGQIGTDDGLWSVSEELLKRFNAPINYEE